MPDQRTALAILILVEVVAFGYMSETVVFPAGIAVAVLLGLRGRWQYEMTQDRQVILALVTALLFVVRWRVQPHSLFDDAMDYLSPFLHSLGQFLLVLQTAALYLKHENDVLPITLPWPGVFVMISAGDVTLGFASTQRIVFQLLALAFTAATASYFAATARAASGTDRQSIGSEKLGVTCVLLLSTAVIAAIAATGLHRYESALNRLVSELLNPAMSSSAAGFPNRAQLGSVSRRKVERANDIALRVYSDDEPRYLRGKAYHWLTTIRGHSGEITQWEEAPTPSRFDDPALDRSGEEVLLPTGTDGERFRFDLRKAAVTEASWDHSMEIWLEAPQWGVYFLPPNAVEVLSNESRLRRDYRQVTSGTDDGAVAYAVRVSVQPDRFPPLETSSANGVLTRKKLTFVPETPGTAGGDAELRAIAEQVFRNCRTVEDHVHAIESYFRSNYGYTIGIDPPGGQDPLHWFLRAKPNAHCEYFAQGAAFLLRLRGIPTRYMTGFVAAERNEYGGYWLARNQHAHAWCEAWDDQRGWVIVEATPAAGVPSETTAPWHRQLWEYLSGRLAQLRYEFSEGGWKWLLRQVVALLMTPPGWVILFLVGSYIVIRLRSRRARPSGSEISPVVVELNRLLRQMDRRTARVGLARHPGETLARFARRIEAETGDTRAAAWYAAYSETRYAGSIDVDAIETLKHRLDTLGSPPKRTHTVVSVDAT